MLHFTPNTIKADTLVVYIYSAVSLYVHIHKLFSFPRLSLQSEAGRFECSVSDLRWVCKEQVSFKYRLCSWEDHMERMESIEYMPAGPLIDITVIAGKLFEVYLPHWICID